MYRESNLSFFRVIFIYIRGLQLSYLRLCDLVKIVNFSLNVIKKFYLCAAKRCFIGLWCNGNTADSGPAFPGSSPGSPAKIKSGGFYY